MNFGVVEVKRNTFRWFDHIERMKSENFAMKVTVSETESSSRRGRSFVRWKDTVKEYMHERVADRGGGIEQARRECLDKGRWKLF